MGCDYAYAQRRSYHMGYTQVRTFVSAYGKRLTSSRLLLAALFLFISVVLKGMAFIEILIFRTVS